MTPQQLLSAARLHLRSKVPYFTQGVLKLIPREAPGLGTFGVSPDMVMLWDPEWVAELAKKLGEPAAIEQVAAVVLHEFFHILRNHAGRARALGAEPKTWNIAADCEINDDFDGLKLRLPDGVILPCHIGAENGGLAEMYYQHIQQQNAAARSQLRESAESGEDSGSQASANGAQASANGAQASEASSPASAGEAVTHGPAAGSCGSGAGGEPLPGEGAGGVGRSEAEAIRARRETAEAIRAHVAQHGKGSVPMGWVVWAETMVQPAKVRWQDELARHVRRAVAYQAGMVDYSYARPARRQGAYGFGVGRPVMPTMRAPKPRVAVAVDTSGSMGDEGISRAASELAGILKAVHADVDFIACDCQVHTTAKVRSAKDFKSVFRGGGGTSFIPAFTAVRQLKQAPSVLVFITDGQGDAPVTPPTGIDVIWVLVGRYQQKPYTEAGECTWGKFIAVEG